MSLVSSRFSRLTNSLKRGSLSAALRLYIPLHGRHALGLFCSDTNNQSHVFGVCCGAWTQTGRRGSCSNSPRSWLLLNILRAVPCT